MNKSMVKQSIFYMSACLMLGTGLIATSSQQESKAVQTKQAPMNQAAQQISKKPVMMTRKAVSARAPNRSIGAAERRNRLKIREEKRKQILEKRRAFAAQKKAQQVAQENDQTKSAPAQKPVAPQNTMLGANISQAPTILKSPASNIKKS